MEKQKTSSKRKAAIKVIVAVLLIAIMIGISFAVANFVHNRKSVQASSVKNGLSAYELAVQQGYAGSLDDWLVSLQGKSAYQIAVDNGYSGSEKDWSKTLTVMSKKDKSDISSAAFSEKGDLVIALSDGTKINVGKAVGASGKDGKDGKDGIGIKSAKINDKGELVISYSDGNSVNLDKVVGETVNNGVGIASSIINEKGELVLTYTNGETANLGGVVGKDGRDGKNGADGKDGRDGTSGTDGISISAAVINESGELVISYSDGTTANLGKVVGSDGINGVNGTNGKDGISVSSAEINSEGELVLSFSNGQRANVGAVVGAKGVYLSGGEQQRIAIARAILKNAPIIILDEATAFADPDNEVRVQQALSALSKGKTVIMIAHRLSSITDADCIYVLQDGEIVESGTHSGLIERNGIFTKMWKDYSEAAEWKIAKEVNA